MILVLSNPGSSYLCSGKQQQETSADPWFRPAEAYEDTFKNLEERRNHIFHWMGEIHENQLLIRCEYGENIHRRATVAALLASYMENLRQLTRLCHRQS